jgi:hypothetical protein
LCERRLNSKYADGRERDYAGAAEHYPQLIDVDFNSCDQLTDALLEVDFRRLVWMLAADRRKRGHSDCPLPAALLCQHRDGWRLAGVDEIGAV